MKRFGKRLTLLAVVLALLPAGVAQAKTPLQAETAHILATPQLEGDWMLAWEGTISGDINGWIEWWIDLTTWTIFPEPTNPAQASHYTMKTRVYDAAGGTLLIETLEHGTTTVANKTWPVTWRANGVVVYADPNLYPGWQGRNVHESGVANLGVFPWEGTSDFRIN